MDDLDIQVALTQAVSQMYRAADIRGNEIACCGCRHPRENISAQMHRGVRLRQHISTGSAAAVAG